MKKEKIIAVIGLGYVGLPLAVEFAKKYKVLGFDINKHRVDELKQGKDSTLEINEDILLNVLDSSEKGVGGVSFTCNPISISEANIFIITVPTPVDKNNNPVLTPLIEASKTVGKVLKQDDIVIYESTVYPGATEEECVPILEEYSGLKFNKDFFCGYSPERINPGDKTHTLTKIKKITSGSTEQVGILVDKLYGSIITAGTYLASNIKVAEAAKVIENAQRDINIAFVNELAKIFNKLDLDTGEVLEAAATKWNFLPYKPGLVGGHCIGVDPYYLAQKSEQLGYHPEIILSGRRVNDSMGEYVATETLKLMVSNGIAVKGSKVLMLGITFKENCPDIRNTKAVDVYKNLITFGMEVDVFDPWANKKEVYEEYGIILISDLKANSYDAIIHTVSHTDFGKIEISKIKKEKGVIYDVKGTLDRKSVNKRL